MFQLDFVFVHVLVTDGRFLRAGSDQLHQDLDGHGPNLWQEVEGLYVRRLIWYSNANGTSLIVEKLDDKSDENMTKFSYNI